MTKVIKKIFYFLSQRKGQFLLLLLVLGGIFLPFAFAHGLAARIASLMATYLATLFLGIFAAISFVLAIAADLVLRFVISPAFINVPYTTNDFVLYGWGIVRDFVNMFFILVLVIIGLATALRIEAYKWQKTLPRLVGVALLINFSPLLLGVVIDFANILMNYFLYSVPGYSLFIRNAWGFLNQILYFLFGASGYAPADIIQALMMPFLLFGLFIAMNLIGGIIYLLFAVLFAMRYIALWILVIISPLAFFCYILPATREFAQKWWNQFVQWCFIGVTGAFFLYLGEYMYNFTTGADQIMGEPPSEIHGMDAGIMGPLFLYFLPVAFLLVGFFAALSTSAMGTSGVTNFARSQVSGRAKEAAKKKWGQAKSKVGSSEKVQGAADRLARQAEKWGQGKGVIGWSGRKVSSQVKEKSRGLHTWSKRERAREEEEAKKYDPEFRTDREGRVMKMKEFKEKKDLESAKEVLEKGLPEDARKVGEILGKTFEDIEKELKEARSYFDAEKGKLDELDHEEKDYRERAENWSRTAKERRSNGEISGAEQAEKAAEQAEAEADRIKEQNREKRYVLVRRVNNARNKVVEAESKRDRYQEFFRERRPDLVPGRPMTLEEYRKKNPKKITADGQEDHEKWKNRTKDEHKAMQNKQYAQTMRFIQNLNGEQLSKLDTNTFNSSPAGQGATLTLLRRLHREGTDLGESMSDATRKSFVHNINSLSKDLRKDPEIKEALKNISRDYRFSKHLGGFPFPSGKESFQENTPGGGSPSGGGGPRGGFGDSGPGGRPGGGTGGGEEPGSGRSEREEEPYGGPRDDSSERYLERKAKRHQKEAVEYRKKAEQARGKGETAKAKRMERAAREHERLSQDPLQLRDEE